MNRLLLGTVLSGLGRTAAVNAGDPPVSMPGGATSMLLGQPRPEGQPQIPAPTPCPAAADACPEPCPTACPAPSPTPCGPRTRIVFPPPVVTFRKSGTKVIAPSCEA